MQDKNYGVTLDGAEDENTSKLSTVNKYDGQTAYTDKYFNQQFNDGLRESYSFMDTSKIGDNKYTSLTGEEVTKDYFKHNNMVPFFGGNVKSKNIDANSNETILDNMIGSGSSYINKSEQAPLFKPGENYQYAHGMPNNTDFMRSRVNPSSRMANVKPFQEERVGPGLNLGYTSEGSGGFNSGMMNRELWTAKTVDDLRVLTNQKSSGHLMYGREGPAGSRINTLASQGKQEKHRPDRDFEMTRDRLLTTTGVHKGETQRSETIERNISRPTTTTEYTGNASYGNSSIYIDGVHNESHRNQLESYPISGVSATGKGMALESDYGMKSKTAYPNNRSENKQEGYFGVMTGSIGAVVAPILDVLKPSRKENAIGNLRPYENAKAPVSKSYYFDPKDKPVTTNREMTEKGKFHLNVNMNGRGAYEITENQVAHTQRESQSDYLYVGGSSAAKGTQDMRSYEAEYNQRNNDLKSSTIKGHLVQGNMNLFTGNIQQRNSVKEKYIDNSRPVMPAGVKQIPSAEHIGHSHSSQPIKPNINLERNTPDLVSVLSKNPYSIPYRAK